MSIIYKYKETICYKMLDTAHKKSFDRLVIHYGKKLNDGAPIGNILYTAHDFNKHCNNIFSIINDIILKNESKLKMNEYYILCLSVLFHDISMSANINWDRNRHSLQSAEYIKSESENTSSALNLEISKSLLSINDINTIRHIITAHSDIKDGSVNENNNGIYNSSLNSNMHGRINGKLLAAILRLADELDITSDRLGSEEFASQLDENDEKQSESKQHWEKLHYFSDIKVNENDVSILNIYCDDEYIQNTSDNLINISDNIDKIKNKINSEIKSLNKEVFRKSENSHINFQINMVKIISKLPDLNKLINEKDPLSVPIKPKNLDPKVEADTKVTNNTPNDNYPLILSHNTQKTLDEFIYKNNLFNGGHYLLTNELCAMDWIDTNEIIETNKICELCINEFAKSICENAFNENTMILGLDFSGSIIASRLAFKLHLPFQCVIPVKSKANHSEKDVEIVIPDECDIILITDVISTYDTIKSVILNYNLENKVKAIYSLLYRNPNIENTHETNFNSSDLKENTYCISKNYPITIKFKDQCEYKNNNTCIAVNLKEK